MDTTEVLRDSIARIVVELERIDRHLAAAAVEPPMPHSCQFVAPQSVGETRVDAPGSGVMDDDVVAARTTTPMGQGDRLLFIDDVAEWTGIPVPTLRWWRQHGKGPRSAKVGARVRYREADGQAWLDNEMEEKS